MTEQPRRPSGRARAGGAARAGGRGGSGEPVVLSGSLLAFGVVALAAEVALFAALGQLAHHYAGGGTRGVVVAAVVLLVAAVLWALFMAPPARRRLALVPRVAVCAVLGLALGGALAGAGWPVWGTVVVIAGIALALVQWTLGRRSERAVAARTDCFPPTPPEGGTS